METIRVRHLSPGIRCPSFTDRGLRLVRPAASPLGGYPKGKSLKPGDGSPAESQILVAGLVFVKEGTPTRHAASLPKPSQSRAKVRRLQ
jgi:hypothetical protein